jgi:hypothetical protein
MNNVDDWLDVIGCVKTPFEWDQKLKPGWVAWGEDDGAVTAPIVDDVMCWPHKYDKGIIIKQCECGCFKGRGRSGGPVDPFGPCPAKPRTPTEVIVFRLLKWLRLWPYRKSSSVQQCERLMERLASVPQTQAMNTVNGLVLPTIVVDLIKAGRWRMPTQPSLLRRVFIFEVFSGKEEYSEGCEFGQPKLYSIPQMQTETRGWLKWAAESPDLLGTPSIIEMPGDIDPACTLFIGDVGPGLDSPIALDYRVSLFHPSVVYYSYPAGRKWVTIAPSIESFVEALELKRGHRWHVD